MKVDLPLDDDDYLMPSPQRSQSLTTTGTSAAYMDLISDSKASGKFKTIFEKVLCIL